MKKVTPAAMCLSLCALLAGCATADWQRFGHDTLMRLDCEQSEARGSCNRDWGGEYRNWQLQRSAHLETLAAERQAHPSWPDPVPLEALPDL